MISKSIIALSLTSSLSFLSHAAPNNPAIDSSVVSLRTSCIEGGNEINNCFNDLTALEGWMNNIRISPSLLIDVAPGTYTRGPANTAGAINCSSKNITIRGSGRTQSQIKSENTGVFPSAGISIGAGCDNLDVQDIKISGWLQGAVTSNSTVSTFWTNVELEGGTYGWLEPEGECSDNDGKHFWYSSSIVATGATGGTINYTAHCAESWFFNSQIVANNNGTGAVSGFALLADDAEVHIYGSNVRLIIGDNIDAAGADVIRSINGGLVHVHGTGLDLIHNGTGVSSVLEADGLSEIHANETSFSLHNNSTGNVERLSGTGKLSSPFQWSSRSVPPVMLSRSGADTYIETDCPATDNCSKGGTFPHTMIYRAECTGTSVNEGPWYDTVTNACRQ